MQAIGITHCEYVKTLNNKMQRSPIYTNIHEVGVSFYLLSILSCMDVEVELGLNAITLTIAHVVVFLNQMGIIGLQALSSCPN